MLSFIVAMHQPMTRCLNPTLLRLVQTLAKIIHPFCCDCVLPAKCHALGWLVGCFFNITLQIVIDISRKRVSSTFSVGTVHLQQADHALTVQTVHAEPQELLIKHNQAKSN